MHDLAVMYARVLDILRATSEDYFDADGNTQTYPRPPKLSDLEVVALAATAECLECGSENLLWAKFHEYPALLPHRGTRQRYNARRRRLRPEIDRANARIADWLDDGRAGDALVIDSMPIETVRVTREAQSRACRRPEFDALRADKTYHASTKRWIVGYKLHAIFTTSGIYVEHVLRPASHHDLTVFKELVRLAEDGALDEGLVTRLKDRLLLADKAYGSKPVQGELFRILGTDLKAVPKVNAADWEPWPYELRRARGYIETVFAQCVDEVKAKLNLAKRFSGINARISAKLLARTIKQFVNYHTGRPLNQTKYCWLG